MTAGFLAGELGLRERLDDDPDAEAEPAAEDVFEEEEEDKPRSASPPAKQNAVQQSTNSMVSNSMP